LADESAPVGQPAPRLDALKVAWWLFGFWVLVTLGVRFGLLLYAELGMGMDTNIVDRDFANYWVGGSLVLDGRYMLLFDQSTYYAHLQSLFGPNYQIHNWGYPPHFLMLCAPLGLMEYRWALFAFLAATFAMFAFAAHAFRREYAPNASTLALWVALFGYVMTMIEFAQNGFFTAALVLTTLAFMRSRPWLAGLALALLTTKPQLGFLIPLLALLDRNWALIKWASVFTVLLVAISIAFLGLESWRAYFELVIPYQKFVMEEWHGYFLRMMPTTFGSIRTLGFAPAVAYQVQWVITALAFALLLRLLWILRDPLDRIGALLVGTFLVTPYAFNYDMGAISVAAALLALRSRANGEHGLTITYGILAVLPAAVVKLGLAGWPISPLLIAAAFVALWLARSRAPAGAPA
jgi:arabinofuranan 3-O-arabinosyltransferase